MNNNAFSLSDIVNFPTDIQRDLLIKEIERKLALVKDFQKVSNRVLGGLAAVNSALDFADLFPPANNELSLNDDFGSYHF